MKLCSSFFPILEFLNFGPIILLQCPYNIGTIILLFSKNALPIAN